MKRDYPERPIVGVGAVIVRDQQVVLVRRNSEPRRGEWALPGGMLELGETLRQGLEREVREETGLQVRVEQALDVFDSIVPDASGRTQFHYVLVDFLCLPIEGELCAGSDVAEAVWAEAADLNRFRLTDNTKAVIRKALRKNK